MLNSARSAELKFSCTLEEVAGGKPEYDSVCLNRFVCVRHRTSTRQPKHCPIETLAFQPFLTLRIYKDSFEDYFPSINAERSGIISTASPTTPKSAVLNIAASGSLLIAMTVLEELIPTTC